MKRIRTHIQRTEYSMRKALQYALRTGREQRGDTIVEVLIAIAVISLVLGGAYVTTNRSLQATRAAQERGQALKLAESQLEQLRALAVSDPAAIFGTATPIPFCVSEQVTVVGVDSEACRVDSSGSPTTTEPVYNLSVVRSSGNTFTVTNEWVDPSGRMTEQVRLIYRVYE